MSTFAFGALANGTTLASRDARWAGASAYNVQSGLLQPGVWSSNVAVFAAGQPTAQRSEVVLPAGATINDGFRLYINNTDQTASTGYYVVITTTGVEWRRLGSWSGFTSVTVDNSVQQTLALVNNGSGGLSVVRNGTTIATYSDGSPLSAGNPGFQLDGGATPGALSIASWTDGISDGPVITAQPADDSVFDGETASFSASATGYTSVQVQTNSGSGWSDVAGETTTSYSRVAALADDGLQVRFAFSDGTNTTYSNAATLTVHAASPRLYPVYGGAPIGSLGWLGRKSTTTTVRTVGAGVVSVHASDARMRAYAG